MQNKYWANEQWNNLASPTNIGAALAVHKSTHVTGGSDALTPADIGVISASPVLLQTYDTPGSYTYTIPENITAIAVVLVGGGQGGDGGWKSSVGGTSTQGGGKGGNGGYVRYIQRIPVTAGNIFSLVVGAGGVGGAAGVGNNVGGTGGTGGTSSFGVFTALGGTSSAGNGTGGAGGLNGSYYGTPTAATAGSVAKSFTDGFNPLLSKFFGSGGGGGGGNGKGVTTGDAQLPGSVGAAGGVNDIGVAGNGGDGGAGGVGTGAGVAGSNGGAGTYGAGGGGGGAGGAGGANGGAGGANGTGGAGGAGLVLIYQVP